MVGRADMEGSKSNVAMNAWLQQANYPGALPPSNYNFCDAFKKNIVQIN